MRVLAFLIVSLVSLTDPTLISKINRLKSDAKQAYLKNDFKAAIQKYRYLVDSLHVREDEVLLNLASAYYNLRDTTNALSQYQSLTASPKNQLRSKAQQQLGVIADQQGKQEEALLHFKEAIKSDQSNTEARYNYELVKKKLEEKKKQDQKKQDQQNKDNKDEQKDKQDKKEDQKKDQEQKEKEQKEKEEKEKQKQEQQKKDQKKKEQDKKDQEKKEKEEQDKKEKEDNKIPPDVEEKLKQMKISPEKAQMLLEAMRAQEKQYLQQNKRKATKPKEKGKPDW